MWKTEEGRYRLTAILLFWAALFWGVGFMALLPPFEGADEIAHFSSIRQIALTGTIPLTGQSQIGRDVEDYAATSPMSYPLFYDGPQKGEKTYYGFFQEGDLKAYQKNYRDRPHNEAFAKGERENWQAQHPPLYYLAMAPVLKLSQSLSLVEQFFVLRLVYIRS